MPELPEVETVLRSLTPKLTGRRITVIEVRNRALRVPVSPRRLRRHALNRSIERLSRRAKYLKIHVEGGSCLIVHLGMSGRLLLQPAGQAFEDHVHVVFGLDNGLELRFKDPRRFGQVDAVAESSLQRDRRFRHLGPEPLSEQCDGEYFYQRSRGLRKPVKNFLMDAEQVVGVGNIYANEALFDAKIHPKRAAGRISRHSWERLSRAVKDVLSAAIREGGTTINDFQDGSGNEGYFQVSLRVYGRKGEPCQRCNAPLKSTVLAGRSTFYCGRCQR